MSQYQMRTINFNAVRDLAVKIDRHPTAYLESDDLKALGIKVFDMCWETGVTADPAPQFCHPYPREDFNALVEGKDLEVHWPYCWDVNQYCCARGVSQAISMTLRGLSDSFQWEKKDVGDTKFGFLHDSYREGDHWQVHGIYDTYNTSIPHLACELVAETMVDDRLLNGEILCATAYMAIRLRDKSYSAHRIAPMFVYSFCRKKARVIEAHYEHPYLIVRKTKVVDFEKEHEENLKLMLRWMMSTPIGDTKY